MPGDTRRMPVSAWLWTLLTVVVLLLVGLLLAVRVEPDLPACDFPEGCLDVVGRRFTPLRWVWAAAMLIGGVGLVVSARHADRTVSWGRLGAALTGLTAAGAISPVGRGSTALSYDRYSNVIVLTGPYLVALVLLMLSALIVTWELAAQRARREQSREPRRPGVPTEDHPKRAPEPASGGSLRRPSVVASAVLIGSALVIGLWPVGGTYDSESFTCGSAFIGTLDDGGYGGTENYHACLRERAHLRLIGLGNLATGLTLLGVILGHARTRVVPSPAVLDPGMHRSPGDRRRLGDG